MSIPIAEILAGLQSAQAAFGMIVPILQRGIDLLAAEEAHRAALAEGAAARSALDASTASLDIRLDENRQLAEAERLRLIREAGGGDTTPPTPEIVVPPRTPAAAAPDPLVAALAEVRDTLVGIGLALHGFDARLAKLEGAAVGGAVSIAVTEAFLVAPEVVSPPLSPTQPEAPPLAVAPLEPPPALPDTPAEASAAPVEAPAQPPVEPTPAPVEPAPPETPTP